MEFDQLLDEIAHLSPEDLEKLKTHLATMLRRNQPRTVEEWVAEFADIATEFRGNSTDEEMREIFDAMNTKNTPSEKGL